MRAHSFADPTSTRGFSAEEAYWYEKDRREYATRLRLSELCILEYVDDHPWNPLDQNIASLPDKIEGVKQKAHEYRKIERQTKSGWKTKVEVDPRGKLKENGVKLGYFAIIIGNEW